MSSISLRIHNLVGLFSCLGAFCLVQTKDFCFFTLKSWTMFGVKFSKRVERANVLFLPAD